jgi:hypothetical protein
VKSDVLVATMSVQPFPFDEVPSDVLLIGKRKPSLNSTGDAARIQKHVDAFDQMVASSEQIQISSRSNDLDCSMRIDPPHRQQCSTRAM